MPKPFTLDDDFDEYVAAADVGELEEELSILRDDAKTATDPTSIKNYKRAIETIQKCIGVRAPRPAPFVETSEMIAARMKQTPISLTTYHKVEEESDEEDFRLPPISKPSIDSLEDSLKKAKDYLKALKADKKERGHEYTKEERREAREDRKRTRAEIERLKKALIEQGESGTESESETEAGAPPLAARLVGKFHETHSELPSKSKILLDMGVLRK